MVGGVGVVWDGGRGGGGKSDVCAVVHGVPVVAVCSARVQEVGGTAPPTQVAVQFTYALNFWVGSEWEQLTEGDVQPPSLVPFGTVTDPVE